MKVFSRHRLLAAAALVVASLLPLSAQTVLKDSLQRYNYFFLEGLRQQGMGNMAAAFDLFRHARDLNPRAAEVYYELAGFYADLKDDRRMAENFRRAAALAPDNPVYQERLGQLHITQKEYDKAIDAYERLYSASKARVDVLEILFQLYASKNDYKGMISVLERMEVLEGSNEQISLSKMQIYEQMGEKHKEYDELRSLVAKHPFDYDYKVMLGNWLLQNGRKADALKAYREVLKDEPDNVMAQLSLYDYYRETKAFRQADGLLVQLLQSRKTGKDTKMALLRQTIADHQEAGAKDSTAVLGYFDKALALPQEDADLVLMKAAYMTLVKAPVEAVNRVYEQAIAVEPENSHARLSLIQNVWDAADYDRVIALCRPAQQYAPENMAFYYYQGLAEFQKGDNDAALTTFQKGVGQINKDSNPNIVSDFYAIMGDILHGKGMDTEAFAAYDSCLQWKPDNIFALNNYAYYLSLKGTDLQKAEQMSYKTVQAEPDNSTYLDTYAWILFLEKRYGEAKTYIEQALRDKDSLSNVVIEHVGDIYSMNGDTAKALEYWQKALDKGNDSPTLKKKIAQQKYIAE